MTDPKPTPKKKIFVGCAIFSGIFLVGYACWFLFFRNLAYTDDAYVEGNKIPLTPLVRGFVTDIFTDDSYLVTKGQILVELDKTNASIALDRASETLASTVRLICRNFHEVFALQASVEVKKADFIKAAQDYEHRSLVVDEGGVSVEDFEHADAALRRAFFSLQMTEIRLEKALSIVRNTSVSSHPDVLAAADDLRQAFVNLKRCTLISPVEGIAAQRAVQVGMWVSEGTPLLSIIPLDQIWVNANFKETQMKRMRIGQSVTLRSDLYGGQVSYNGKIAGLPGGAGNAFSILPPQNLSGNWIKIVQRLPVRVELDPDQLREHPLRIGLSMEARVDLTEEGLLVPEEGEQSPMYTTNVFQREETGDLALIRKIIEENGDPSLSEFMNDPLIWK